MGIDPDSPGAITDVVTARLETITSNDASRNGVDLMSPVTGWLAHAFRHQVAPAASGPFAGLIGRPRHICAADARRPSRPRPWPRKRSRTNRGERPPGSCVTSIGGPHGDAQLYER